MEPRYCDECGAEMKRAKRYGRGDTFYCQACVAEKSAIARFKKMTREELRAHKKKTIQSKKRLVRAMDKVLRGEV